MPGWMELSVLGTFPAKVLVRSTELLFLGHRHWSVSLLASADIYEPTAERLSAQPNSLPIQPIHTDR